MKRQAPPHAVEVSAPRLSGTSRLPPFGREVRNLIAAGEDLNLFIFAGRDGWRLAKARRAALGPGTALVLPDGENWSGFRWPVARQYPLLVWPDAKPRERVDFGDYGTNLDCSSDGPRSPQVMRWRTRPGLVCRVGRDLDVGLSAGPDHDFDVASQAR